MKDKNSHKHTQIYRKDEDKAENELWIRDIFTNTLLLRLALFFFPSYNHVHTYVLSRNPINLYSASLHIPKLTSKLQQQE